MLLNRPAGSVAAAGLAAGLLLGGVRPASAQYAHLTLQSQPGDLVGLGKNYDITYTPANTVGGYFGAYVRKFNASRVPTELLFNFLQPPLGANDNYAELFFGTDQLGIPIQPGTYTDTQTADTAAPGHAGMEVDFDSRAIVAPTGSFTITNAVLTPDAAAQYGYRVDQFDVTFDQHSGSSSPTLFGTFSYRSFGSPPAVPESASLSLLALGLLPVALLARKRRPHTA